MPVEHDPFSRIVNVHWEEGLWQWNGVISVKVHFIFCTFPCKWNVAGDSGNEFDVGPQPLQDGNINNSGSTTQEFFDENGRKYGGGTFQQYVGSSNHAEISWSESALFRSREEAEAHIPLGGIGALTLMVQGVLNTVSSPPNAFVQFQGAGLSALVSPEGEKVLGGLDSVLSELTFFNPYPGSILPDAVSYGFAFDMVSGTVTRSETKGLDSPSGLLRASASPPDRVTF